SGWTRGIQIRVSGVTEGVLNYSSTGFDVHVPGGIAAVLDLELDEPGLAPLVIPHAITRKDLQPPNVVSWAPFAYAARVPLNSALVVTCAEPVAPASTSAIRLWENNSGLVLPGTSTVSTDGKTVSFQPSAPLRSTTDYQISVVGVTDLSANAVPNGANQSTVFFRSVDVVPPVVQIILADSGHLLTSDKRLSANTLWRFTVSATDDGGYIGGTTLAIDGVGVPYSNGYSYRWPTAAAGSSSTLLATATDYAGN